MITLHNLIIGFSIFGVILLIIDLYIKLGFLDEVPESIKDCVILVLPNLSGVVALLILLSMT